MQKRLKNDPKISNFLKFSNDLKNVSRHCGGPYNIKIEHFEHFLGGGLFQPPPCQVGLIDLHSIFHQKRILVFKPFLDEKVNLEEDQEIIVKGFRRTYSDLCIHNVQFIYLDKG